MPSRPGSFPRKTGAIHWPISRLTREPDDLPHIKKVVARKRTRLDAAKLTASSSQTLMEPEAFFGLEFTKNLFHLDSRTSGLELALKFLCLFLANTFFN